MLAAQAIQFFVAGFETTGSTISFTLYELSLNPPVQDRLRKEILTVIKEHGGITYEAIQHMNYLDMTIKGIIFVQLAVILLTLPTYKQFFLQKR